MTKAEREKLAPTEAQTQRAILDLLAAKRIFALRMNTGAMSGSHKGKRWFVRFGVKGMADIVAFPWAVIPLIGVTAIRPLWIECKSASGKQSDEQSLFQAQVEENGHCYLLARSVDDVSSWLIAQGAKGRTR